MLSIKNSDATIPALGFGTWKLKGDECTKCVKHAMSVGYRHIDTAQIYENEEGVGQALTETEVSREDIFLVTKIWMDKAREGDLQKSMEESLRKLQTDYVDLVLMHWPVEDVPFEETFKAFQDIQRQGKTKHIGVSNFTVSQMQQVREELGAKIITNQVEYHPSLSQDSVLQYLRAHDMFLTAYSPLGRGEDLENDVFKALGEKYNKTGAQIILRWLVQQQSVAAIPKSSNFDRIEQNYDIWDFELDSNEMQQIFSLARPDGRMIDPDWAPEWDNARKAA